MLKWNYNRIRICLTNDEIVDRACRIINSRLVGRGQRGWIETLW